jgi:hypothetical protein
MDRVIVSMAHLKAAPTGPAHADQLAFAQFAQENRKVLASGQRSSDRREHRLGFKPNGVNEALVGGAL